MQWPQAKENNVTTNNGYAVMIMWLKLSLRTGK